MMDLFEFAATQQKQDPRVRYDELCATIRHNNELYYAQAQPEITDAEYDKLYRELEALEADHPEWVTPNSPTQRVGNDLSEGFRKVTHPAPMLSIDDIFEHKEGESDAELVEFYKDTCKRIKRIRQKETPESEDDSKRNELSTEELQGDKAPVVVVEPKIDGCAVTLMYRKGKLIYAATRGDGRTGDDITANVRTIRSVPFTLPDDAPEVLEVRGEIYMPSADFDVLNEQRDADGLPTFANPRNATAGTIKLLDAKEVATRPLRFLAHGIGAYEGESLRSADDYEALLRRMGIPCNQPILRVKGLDSVRRAVKEIDTLRRTLGYGTDGAVIKLSDFSLRESLGNTARAPRWAAAFKYLPEQKETILKGITIQVGRTGVLTPVAELEPVQLSGTTVSRATLHNQDEITRKDIRIGDTVLMEKSGEIIPAVVHVVKDKRPADALPYSLYDAVGGVCPCCGAPIMQEEGQVAWRCTNFTCSAQAAMRTTYFCKREALDIENLGGTVAEALVNRGMITSPLDLFRLTVEELGNLNLGTDDAPRRFGEKNAAKAIAALEAARKLPLERWLTAFGIPTLGKVGASSLSKSFPSLTALSQDKMLADIAELNIPVEVFNYLNPGILVPKEREERYLNEEQRKSVQLKWNWYADLLLEAKEHLPQEYEKFKFLENELSKKGTPKKTIRNQIKQLLKEIEEKLSNCPQSIYEVTLIPAKEVFKTELSSCKQKLLKTITSICNKRNIPIISDSDSTEEVLYLYLSKKAINIQFKSPWTDLHTTIDKTVKYFASTAGMKVLSSLRELGINPISPQIKPHSTALNSLIIVLTGTLSKPRSDFEKMITEAGGKIGSAISKNTSYLVAGEGGGSKRQKAEKLNIPIINEEELLKLIHPQQD